MTPTAYAWLIPALPAFSFGALILFGYRLGGRRSAWLSISLLVVSAVLAILLLVQTDEAAPRWSGAGLRNVEAAEVLVERLEHELLEAERVGVSEAGLEVLHERLEAAEERVSRLQEFALVRPAAPGFPFTTERSWLAIRGEAGLPFGFFIDPFAAVMVFMVTLVSLLIHLFSLEYMANEPRYPTFFAYISLFASAMLGMVMSKNLFHLLLFWELMGVMSYLLIGFFYKKVAAQQAMKKAFLVTKLADLGLMLGIFWLYRAFGTLDLPTIQAAAPGLLAGSAGVATGIGLLLFFGAVGKSAQFPLHVWLLDAMEGPTPVSAMIHAATMVAAGVFLIARLYPVLLMGDALPVVAWVGGFTALFAAVLAPAFADIKKILAWSTVSQLGLMFLGLGAFGWVAAVFHLVAHAFFKALLFLCSGAMIHGTGTQDIFEMDRLKKHIPTTRWTFLIGGLSLAGVVPFAGFWSKDEVLLAVSHAAGANGLYLPLLLMAYAASLLTAFYIARAYLIAFEKPATVSPWNEAPWNRGAFAELNMSADEVEGDVGLETHASDGTAHDTPHEVGWPMGTALWVLAGSAVVIGFVGSPLFGNALQTFVYAGERPHLEPLEAQWPGFLVGTLLALIGLGLAWILYGSERVTTRAPEPLTQLLQKRFYIDAAYYRFIAAPLTKLAAPVAWIDQRLLDRAIDLGAWLVAVFGDALRRVQTGRLEHYAWTLAAGALVLIFALGLGGVR